MNNLGVSFNEKKKCIFLGGRKQDEKKLIRLIFSDINRPNKLNILFNKGDFGIAMVITCFSEEDFKSMRHQIKEHI